MNKQPELSDLRRQRPHHMKAKKKEFREPETVKGYALKNAQGGLTRYFGDYDSHEEWRVKVRIIREYDYQRLLAAARRRKGK